MSVEGEYFGVKMQQLAIKMSPSVAFWDAKDGIEESKSVRNEILGALGCQSGIFGGPYGALGIEKGAPGYHFGSQKSSKIRERNVLKHQVFEYLFFMIFCMSLSFLNV
jgi:hypothetical protein